MTNILEAVYFATAILLLMALVRFIGSRRAQGEDRAILVEKARRYFILSGVMGVASIGGYTVTGGPSAGDARVPTAADSLARAAALPAAKASTALVPWMLVPGRGALGIGSGVTHEMLRKRLGDSIVVVRALPEAGGTVNGTVLFPNDSMRRLEILWHDELRERPAVLRVRGSASHWRLHPGIALGSPDADGKPLSELRVAIR
ncbi:MAG: hypothetical protein ACYC0B_01580 [Gemmatimonadaceae bacterium]